MEALELYQFINHVVTVRLSLAKAAELKLDEPRISGKVTEASPTGLVLAAKSTATILRTGDILGIRLKRDRVITRVLRIFTEDDDVRQHLADRHGAWMSLLRTLSPEAALAYHNKIDHSDLGHQHGLKPGTHLINGYAAEHTMRQLDEME